MSTWRDAMFASEKVNATEHFTALHTALRVEPMDDDSRGADHDRHHQRGRPILIVCRAPMAGLAVGDSRSVF